MNAMSLTDSPIWFVPFASIVDEQGDWHTPAQVLNPAHKDSPNAIHAPHLRRLFRWPCQWTLHRGEADSLTPPHQWVEAWRLGWLDHLPPRWPKASDPASPWPSGVADGALPWAAHEMQHRLSTRDAPAAWFVPCHQEVGMDHVRLHPPTELALSDAHSRELMQALQPWAEEDGIHLEWVSATRWLATGAPLRGLRCAALDRVVGRSLGPWLAASSVSAPLRRLMAEAQMLFYTHPAHDERVNSRLRPVNGFWIEGNGVAPVWPVPVEDAEDSTDASNWTTIETLHVAAQQGDIAAWQAAWSTIDATWGSVWLHRLQSGQAVCLWLAGERSVLVLRFQPMTPVQHMVHALKTAFNSQRACVDFSLL